MNRKQILIILISKAMMNYKEVRPIRSRITWDKALIKNGDRYELHYEHKIKEGWTSSIMIAPLTKKERELWSSCPASDIYLGLIPS